MSGKVVRALVFLVLFLTAEQLSAYNFLYIHPTSGEPITWEAGSTIEYWLDPGDLGELTNEQAHTLLQEAMKIWEEASPYADVPHFEFAGYLDQDVTGENYEDYVSLFQCYTEDLESCVSQAQKDLKTVIIFDEDRSILKNELCRITACSASAGAKVFSGSSADPGNIVQGIAVFGGTNGSDSPARIVGTFIHELGHILGLAHPYSNQQLFTKVLFDEEERVYIPTMELYTDLGLNNTEDNEGNTLSPDDIAGISVLYPSENMEENTTTIRGEVLKADGTPMQYVNVIARNIEDPLCEAYSFLSGRICPEGTHTSGLGGALS